MRPQKNCLSAIVTLVVVLSTSAAVASPPWANLLPFHRVEANASNDYELTKSVGPWTILGASFIGDRAKEQAHELVLELRKEHGLEAWLTKQRFDLTGAQPGLGLTPTGDPKVMRHMRYEKYDEYAVMIGQFESFDDPNAQKTLERVKYLKPDCLDISKRNVTHQRMAVLREVQRRIFADPEKKNQGPMRVAFLTRNPLLPKDERGPALEPFVVKLNSNVEHSLIRCPGKYSVKVATFRGDTTMDQKRIEELSNSPLKPFSSSGAESKLAVAAANAHALTTALRERGVKAFEFHDRQESIVTVGTFESVGTPRQDGKTEINPQIHAIMQSYGAEKKAIPGTDMTGFSPQSWKGIPFDIQPEIVQVPHVDGNSQTARGGPLSWLR